MCIFPHNYRAFTCVPLRHLWSLMRRLYCAAGSLPALGGYAAFAALCCKNSINDYRCQAFISRSTPRSLK
jgi:hypothetical protein